MALSDDNSRRSSGKIILGLLNKAQGVAWHFNLVEWIAVLARDQSESVDEVAVEDEGHVVEEERFEGFRGRVGLLVRWRAGNGFDERPVSRKLLIDRGLAVVKFFLSVVLTAEHGIASFRS